MSKPQVLIVGAGALGLTMGYHLHLAGAEISFLVRPHRQKALSQPQRLYCYDDHRIKLLDNYRVYSTVDEFQGQEFDFVLLTLDGVACRSEDGEATLAALGKALAGTDTRLMINAVGIGLYEHVVTVTGFASDNVLQGSMNMFAYQVERWDFPLTDGVDVALHNSAVIAYITFPKRFGVMLASKPAAKAFAQLYDQCGVAKCKLLPVKLYRMISNVFFSFTLCCELTDWQGTRALVDNEELWALCCQSQREIMRLKEHGLLGRVMAFLARDRQLAKAMLDFDSEASAMGFTNFNHFHHGGKVLEQDLQIVRNCIDAGEREGLAMAASKEILARWHERQGSGDHQI